VVDLSTVVVAASLLEARWETTETAITVTMPVLKAGIRSLVFVDIESGVGLAVQNLRKVLAYPQGNIVLRATPTFGISEEIT
jgi:hypothetical protein